MSLDDLEKKVVFLNNFKNDKKKSDLILLHAAISFGSSPSKKNNDKFSRYLEKSFNKKPKPEDEESFEDVINLVNKGNVKK